MEYIYMILLNGDYAILMMFHYFMINIIVGLQVGDYSIYIYECKYIHSYKWSWSFITEYSQHNQNGFLQNVYIYNPNGF